MQTATRARLTPAEANRLRHAAAKLEALYGWIPPHVPALDDMCFAMEQIYAIRSHVEEVLRSAAATD